MKRLIHRILYRTLSLEHYLRAVSALFFMSYRLGLGRRSAAMEYPRHLHRLVRRGDTVIDIGANLGYYSRILSRLAGPEGRVYAVEPVAPIRAVLRRNLRRCANVEIVPYALGEQQGEVTMANGTEAAEGYFGTGRNFVRKGPAAAGEREFTARMRRGSELFSSLERIDMIKCDIEGYEGVVMREMRPLLERHRPTVLIETGGEQRPGIVALFRSLGYEGFTLERGREVPLTEAGEKDIIFRVKKP